jgi:hypothetical protein
VDLEAFATAVVLLLCGGIVGYRFRVAEAVRGDRAECYLKYLRVINSFPMNVLTAVESSDPNSSSLGFRGFQNDAQAASTEVALVASTRVVAAVVEVNRALSKQAIWSATEALGRSENDSGARSQFLTAYWKEMSGPRKVLLESMRKDLHFPRLRGLSLDDVEGVRQDGAAPVP